MRALISVSDKSGIESFASGLATIGFEIISTGGTYQLLKKAGIPAIGIESVTGFPEMMDGRVKTLHPKIHGGLLALRDNPEHVAALQEHAIQPIDLVVVNLYPFQATISKPNVSLEEAIENIDIGGPSMIRSAAKNFRSVGVVVNPDRYSDVLAELSAHNGQLSDATRYELATEAFTHTARYDSVISNYLTNRSLPDADKASKLPDQLAPILKKVQDLRYGENPHQRAAFYSATTPATGLAALEQLHGKELSYNNIVDLEAAWQIVRETDVPAAAIIKHTNPCGAAIGATISEAYQKAHDADPVSAFGSIVGLNRTVDKPTAEAISKTFVEVVIAPGFAPEAFAILTKKEAIRLVTIPHFEEKDSQIFRYVQGGFLVQDADNVVAPESGLSVATKRRPSADETRSLQFAFTIVKHVKSNAIVLAKDGIAVGVGAGQMSRVESVEIAIKKAGIHAVGSVAASDAFFPFGDSVELLAKAGVTAVIQPGGSKKDQESVDACDKHGMAMVFTGIRHFKH